jgi:hypothetical protein
LQEKPGKKNLIFPWKGATEMVDANLKDLKIID